MPTEEKTITTPPVLLVFGQGSQIGQAVREAAKRDEYVQIISLGRGDADVTSFEQIQKAVEHYRPDFVLNCAGFNNVDEAERQPELSYQLNVQAIAHVAEACRQANLPLIHLSTDLVFNGQSDRGYTETDDVEPLSVYGKHKWQSEELVREKLPHHFILRISWIFSHHGRNVITRTVSDLRLHERLRVADDRKGCPTPSADIARVLLAVIKQLHCGANNWGTYHYCGAEVTSRFGLCKEILMAAAQFEPFRLDQLEATSIEQMGSLAKRPLYSVLSCKKLLNHFGIRQLPWRNELSGLIRNIYINPELHSATGEAGQSNNRDSVANE